MADRDLYTVGWICAITTELVAALAMLDERHERPKELDPNDSNNYELGEISNHYVVIACLPEGEYGTSAATDVAINLLRSFPNVRFGLMVGIGGGAPTSNHDIRLGDVVVSTPGDGKGGVFQYDLGKSVQNQTFVETGFLDQPPSLLRTAVAGLKARYEIDGHALGPEVNEALHKNPRLKKRYSRPHTGDRLYKSTFTHVSGVSKDCLACGEDPSSLILRHPREENEDDPVIHYGLIASANKLMKDAIIRDTLAVERGVLCFEMEAAGLMNRFPCLVIRGICDYADTHKNDEWQGFAAMMAAAYARDLLRRLVPEQVQARKKANEILLGLKDQLSELAHNTGTIAYKLNLAKLSIASDAESASYANQHEDECLPGTRIKILHDIEKWATLFRSKRIFWLNGMAGTGKSTISRTLAKRFLENDILGASFFFKRGEEGRGNAKQFFPTLASQLQARIPGMVDYLREVIDDEPQISAKSLKEQFERLILEPISRLKTSRSLPLPLVIVIDALDECENDKDIRVILHLLPQVQECSSTRLRIFVTSRPDLPIRLGFDTMGGNDYQDLILHQIPRADIQHDIRLFLEYKLADIRNTRSLPQDWPGVTKIATLVTISVPLFIYAATMCRVFEDHDLDPEQCLDDYLNEKAEESKLDAIYLPVLNRIGAKYSDNSRRKDQLIQDVKDMLSVIILLESPLSIFSLSKLIDLPTMAIKARLSSLHSVLYIPDDEAVPIRLFHLSFRDFLLDHETPKKTAIWTDEKATHGKLAIRCFEIMRTLKKNICGLLSPATDRRHGIKAETISHCIPTQLQYSCRYWAYHLTRSHDLTTQLKNAQYFLEKKFLYWVEAMSILGVLSEVTDILRNLQSISKHEGNSEMSKLLHDAIRYILRNQTIINATPLQLYVSGLLFAPTASEMKRLFTADLPVWISMPYTTEDSWGAELGTLEGSDKVDDHCITFSPNGLLLAAGGHDGTIRLWNAVTGNLLQKLSTEEDFIRALVFSRDSELLISCSGSIADHKSTTGKLQFWDTITGTLQSTLDEDVDDVTSLVFTDGDRLLASPSKSWDFLTWDRLDGVQKHILPERLTEDMNTVLSLDGLLLASHCFDRNIHIWNVLTGTLQHTLLGHGDIVCATFSPNGQVLASIDEDGIIIFWDTTTGIQQQRTMRSAGQAGNITFSPNGQLLASSHGSPRRLERDLDGTISLWDVNTCNLVRTLKSIQGAVCSTYFSPDGETLVSVSKNGKNRRFIKLWDATNISPTQTPHLSYPRAMAFSLDGQLLASVCGTGTIAIWNAVNETTIRNLRDPVQIKLRF